MQTTTRSLLWKRTVELRNGAADEAEAEAEAAADDDAAPLPPARWEGPVLEDGAGGIDRGRGG